MMHKSQVYIMTFMTCGSLEMPGSDILIFFFLINFRKKNNFSDEKMKSSIGIHSFVAM